MTGASSTRLWELQSGIIITCCMYITFSYLNLMYIGMQLKQPVTVVWI